MSSMWTSSMNSTWGPPGGASHPRPGPLFSRCAHPKPPRRVPTPGMISALPSSRHSATLALICSRTSDLISPVSPVGGVGEAIRAETGIRGRRWMKEEEDKAPGTEGRETKSGVAEGTGGPRV